MALRIENDTIASVNASADWTVTPTYGVLWANGVPIDSNTFEAAVERPEDGDAFQFPVGGMRFDNAITSMNEAGTKEIFDAAVEAGTINWRVSLHDGDPGADYTANEITAAEAPGYVPGASGRMPVTIRLVRV